MRIILAVITLFTIFVSFGQERFQKAYLTPMDDRVEDGYVYENKYILAGHARSFEPTGLHDGAIVMLDSIGEIIWSRKYDSMGEEYIHGLAAKEGFIYATGRTNSFHGFFMKVDLDGNIVFNRKIVQGANSIDFYDMVPSGDDFVLVGKIQIGIVDDPILLKVDNLGNIIWAKQYKMDEPSSELIFNLAETENGDFLITGMVDNIGAGLTDYILFRVDSEGDFLWCKTYGNDQVNISYKVVETVTNELLLCGRYRSGAFTRIGLLKLTSDGELIWGKSYAQPDNIPYSSVVESSDGNYVIRASCSYIDLVEKAVLMKVDTAGNILWTQSFAGKENFQGAQQFFETQDHGFFIPTSSNNGQINFGMIKTDSLGLTACSDHAITLTLEPIDVITNSFEMVDSLIIFTTPSAFITETISLGDTTYCCDSVVAHFTYESIGDGIFSFQADYMPGATYTWTFGEETLDGQEVLYSFASDGNEDICLYVSNYCNADSICENVSILSTGGDRIDKPNFVVYPNPFNDKILIQPIDMKEEFTFVIFDQSGKRIYQSSSFSKKVTYDTTNLKKGVYIVQVRSKNGELNVVKMIKF